MLAAAPHDLAARFHADPFVGYAYSYPHKTAYRTLAPARSLGGIWRDEPRRSLSLYVHIPFCEMRCGFCNLFTYSQPAADWVAQYLAAVQRQMQVVADEVPGAAFAQMAIGGGTPTYLRAAEMEQLLAQLGRVLHVPWGAIPISVEASPATMDRDKLALLRQHGVTRLSLGIQSFLADDLGAMGRPQKTSAVRQAIELVRAAGFPVLNLDLIYGAEGQTSAGWLESVREAVRYQPEELYLYPLYVRPLTGLGNLGSAPTLQDSRLDRYREAREWLLANGYEQVSLRMFRRCGQVEAASPVYCCQSDGMIGLGVGARSYTRSLHYASRFAVRQKSILSVIQAYSAQSPTELAQATHGFELDSDEQRRRYLLLSLLQASGLELTAYAQRFASDVLSDFPQLLELEEHGLATRDAQRLTLTPAGLELSDAIGPWLYSAEVRRRMQEYAWTDA